MKYLFTYLSTAPVIGTFTITFLASFLIELNRFFPDLLSF